MARCGGDTADQNCSDLSNRIEGQQPLATLLAGRVVSREGDSFTSSSDLEANTDVNVVIGDLDFGSGGGDSGVKTHFVWVPNEIIAYPFTVKQGNYHGRVGIYPTSSPYPTDGSGIRLWWSRTPGGEQLPGTDCNPDVGKLSSHNWTQVISERSYGCQIPNEDATLYLNVQACISTYDDLNCTADGAKPGSVVPTYIAGRVFVRDDDTPVTPTTPTTPAASSALTSARDTTKDNGSAILKFKYNTRYENINITLNELVRNGGEDIATDEKKKWIVINEYINQIGQESGQEKTMEYSDFMAAINRQAVMQWGSGGNYQYVYHAVGVIIESICNGTEIIQTDLSGANNSNNSNNRNNSNNNNVGEPTCIDIDVTNISGGAGLITSECLDECKHPKDYPALSTEYQKYKSNYQNSDSSYYDSIVIKKDATLYYKGPDKSALNGDKYSLFQSQIDKNIRFESGTVTSIPFTVPDYYEPDWINQKDAIDYNSFYMDIDVATFIGDVTPGSEPELLVWWSTYAGGPALGESFIIVGAGGTEVVATFSSLLLNKNSDINIVGYLGNKYGSRWINFATVNKDLSEAISVKDLEIGSTAFMNRLSNFGLELNGSNQKNSLTLSMTIPVPDCSKLVTVSSSNITTQPSDTMRSLPNMNPYIGDDWDGSIPSHVEIATNGGYKWGYAPGSQPFPAGFGPGNESPRLTGSLVYYPQPTNGKILSYEWASTNKKIVPSLSLTWVWSPSGGQQVLNSCSPSLTVVRWFSATPGGRPLLNIDGQRRIFDIGDATNDRNFRMQQLYDVNDSYIDYFYTIPVITKKYFLNAACIESSLFATLEAQGRAPTASEVREFNPLACGSDTSYSYVVGGPTGSSYDFDTWLKEKPSKGERFI
jgi:hypothetical protein